MAAAAPTDNDELKDLDVSYLNDRLDAIFKNTGMHVGAVHVDKNDKDENKMFVRFRCEYRHWRISRETSLSKADLKAKSEAVLAEIDSMACDAFEERAYLDLKAIQLKSDVFAARMKDIHMVKEEEEAEKFCAGNNDDSKTIDVSFLDERLDKIMKNTGIQVCPVSIQLDDKDTIIIVVRCDYRGRRFGKALRTTQKQLEDKHEEVLRKVDQIALSCFLSREWVDLEKNGPDSKVLQERIEVLEGPWKN
jgi:hypothetical protein